MKDEQVSIGTQKQVLLQLEAMISSVKGRQAELLQELDAANVAAANGYKTLWEWAAARLDVGPETAKELVRMAKALPDRP